jgi:hypothetical protein
LEYSKLPFHEFIHPTRAIAKEGFSSCCSSSIHSWLTPSPPPFSPHPSYRVNWKLPLNTGAPPPPRVSPSPPKPAATPVSCHLGELQPPRPCLADSPRPPGALVAAAAAPRPTAHQWQACDRVCRCVMIATHTCRTARHGSAGRCGR